MTNIENPTLYGTYKCASGLVMHIEFSANDDTPPESVKCPCPYALSCVSLEKNAELVNITTVSPVLKLRTKQA